jgi:hypothetical protein
VKGSFIIGFIRSLRLYIPYIRQREKNIKIYVCVHQYKYVKEANTSVESG